MTLKTDHFNNNMMLIKEHHPLTYETLQHNSVKPIGELVNSADGTTNLCVQSEDGTDIFIHDINDTTSEIQGFYELVPEHATGVVMFVGMGLGYAPQAMLRTRKNIQHLIIFEPEVGLFLQALHALDQSSLLTDRRVTIALGRDTDVHDVIAPVSRALLLEATHILNHVRSSQIAPQTYKNLYDKIYKESNSLNIGGLTTRTYGGKFIENRLSHLSAIHHQQLLEHLQDAFSGVPAIIVSGGPSLNKNIHLLPKAKGKSVIIAADTVLPALLSQNIAPDFTTTIDMQDIVIEKIVDMSAAAHQTSLVCASWVSPTIPKNFPARQIFWTFAAKHMENWLNHLLGGTLLTSGAGTVAHLSFTTAVLLGCSPIIFVGQDLAFTDNQDHANHTSLTQKNDLENLFKSNEIEWVEGYGGMKVPTSRGWLSDKHHFERLMSQITDKEFINSTEGGVRLVGAEELPLQETLSKFCVKDIDITTKMKSVEQNTKISNRRRMVEGFGKMLRNIATVEKNMEQMTSVTGALKKEIAILQKQGGKYPKLEALPGKVKKQIDTLDILNSQLDKARVWKLLDEITMDGLMLSERLNYDIQKLEGDPKRFLEYIDKSIDRFILINNCRREVLVPFKNKLKVLQDRLKRESVLLKNINKKNADAWKSQMDLLALYQESKDHVLMQKIIDTIPEKNQATAEIYFYKGVVASNQSRFENAERFFNKALTLSPSMSDQIIQCRKELAEKYISFANEWKKYDADVVRRMLFKAFRHCPDHPVLITTLTEQLDDTLSKAEDALEKNAISEMAEKLKNWTEAMITDKALAEALGTDKTAALHRLLGCALVAKNEYNKAMNAFSLAAEITPKNPELHLLHADAAFSAGNYTSGVESLDKAVVIDRRYAQFWENMGDNLARSGQPQDAVAAYERCLLALPENFNLLKKIGDCYRSDDQPEAALEAYNHFKAKAATPAPPEAVIANYTTEGSQQ